MMEWLNEPARWSVDNDRIRVWADAHTDFWRITHDGAVRDNGHFYAQAVRGDFTMEVAVSGAYNGLYDQAGLMVRQDDRVWLKCGIEFFNNMQHASAVMTRETSDWSVMPLLEAPPFLRLRVERRGVTLEVHYALPDGDFHLMRQAYIGDAPELLAGLLVAAPVGDGFEAVFEGLQIHEDAG